MKKVYWRLLGVALGMVCPMLTMAQDSGGLIGNLQTGLYTVYTGMLKNSGGLIGVGQALAGFGALWYIAYRVWGHLARAESIDFFPLLRPFAIGIVLIVYPDFIALFNGVLQPTVDGTNALVGNTNQSIRQILSSRDSLISQGNEWQAYAGSESGAGLNRWQQIQQDSSVGALDALRMDLSERFFSIGNTIKLWMSKCLETVYEAAALCINAVRYFYLLVLAIIGPLVFGLAVFDGFHGLIQSWAAKYIHVFLWLPVCNIFGAMIGEVQLYMIQHSTGFGPTSVAYLVFLIMGISGYAMVPSVTQNIITVFPVPGLHRGNPVVNAVKKAGSDAALAIVSGV